MTTDTGIPREWREYKERAWAEILRLAHADDVFWQMQSILQANPDATKDGLLSEWMGQCYSDSAVMAIRRLGDRTKNCHSLWRLLTFLARNPTLLTKERYIGMHDGFLKEKAEEWWVELTGGDEDHIPRAKIIASRDRLASSLKKVSDFANRAIAHSGEPSDEPALIWQNIRHSICAAFECYRWVSLVFDSSDPVTAVPTYQGNWLMDLHVAWLPKESDTPPYQHLDQVLEEFQALALEEETAQPAVADRPPPLRGSGC